MTQPHTQAAAVHGPPVRLRRSRGRLLVGSLVAAVAVVLIATGCTTPQVSPSPSSTPSVETTAPAPPPTTVAPVYKPASKEGPAENVPVPVLPEKAKEFSKDGLIAFSEYWYSTLGYAFETGDPKPMLDVSSESCEMCKAMEETVVPWHAEGRWIVGGQMTMLDASATFAPTDDGSYQVLALVRQNHLQFYRGDKSLSQDLGQESSVADVLVATHDSISWSAVKIGRLDGSPS